MRVGRCIGGCIANIFSKLRKLFNKLSNYATIFDHKLIRVTHSSSFYTISKYGTNHLDFSLFSCWIVGCIHNDCQLAQIFKQHIALFTQLCLINSKIFKFHNTDASSSTILPNNDRYGRDKRGAGFIRWAIMRTDVARNRCMQIYLKHTTSRWARRISLRNILRERPKGDNDAT